MKKLLLAFSLLLMVCNFLFVVNPNYASALYGSEFKAGRIIDDGVFFNPSGMNVTSIQNFLNAKLPVCDTNGTNLYAGTTRAAYGTSHGYPPPYTCLKDYSMTTTSKPAEAGLCNGYGAVTQTAAQIIDGVAKSCGINPKVLIILLQKEQSLVTDDWPWSVQYRSATGYGCPDTAPCDSQYYGFFNQVYSAAKQFKNYAKSPNYFNYRFGQNNYILYNPNSACDGSNVFIQNQATAGLYNYTPYQPNAAALNNLYGTGDSCSAYGNRNFWRMYNDWFGSTYLLANDCDSRVGGVACVWSLMKSDGSQFLTSSKSERDLAINNFGWIYEGVAFYATQTQRKDTVPVYRLRQSNQHYYTTDQSEYNSMKNSGSWIDEGISFYVYPSTTSTNISHKVFRLYNSTLGRRYWSVDENKKDSLISMGYTLESNAFNGFSGLADLPIPTTGRINIYRLQGGGKYFYTPSLYELETAINSGSYYEGVLTTSSANNSGTPVYRLRSGDIYFYTTNSNERNNAIQKYGMTDEGVGYYLDEISAQIYRLANTVGGRYLYTSNIDEVMSAANINSWRYEGVLIDKDITPSPVYRFLNIFNGRHFYTIDLNEAAQITNKGWKYEGIAFSTSKTTGLPVYRLRINNKYFFTVNSNERNVAISSYGYLYEGVAYYVSHVTTDKPVYRLQGNDEYFYTASSSEKDRAISKYGYHYEGVVFYLP